MADKNAPVPRQLLANTKALRQNMTEAEKQIWYHLLGRRFFDFKFRRQVPIPPYIVDFICEDRKLIVEVDGGQHSADADAERTAFLERQGFTVMRFWNNDVLANTEGVLAVIKEYLDGENERASPHPSPLPEGGGMI